LINVLTGLLKPNQEAVLFKEMEITGIGPERLSKLGLAGVFTGQYFPILLFLNSDGCIVSRLGQRKELFFIAASR